MRCVALVSVLLMTSSCSFEEYPSSDPMFRPAYLLDDVDGDGKAEVLLRDPREREAVLVSGEDGATLWERKGYFAVSDQGDWDGDGDTDFLVHERGGLRVIDGASGDRLWGYAESFGNWRARFFGDVDGDGLQDVIRRRYTLRQMATFVVTGTADSGTLWSRPPRRDEWFSSNLSVVDVDCDGVADVLLVDGDGVLLAYEGLTGELLFEAAWGEGPRRSVHSVSVLESCRVTEGPALLVASVLRNGTGIFEGRSIHDGRQLWIYSVPVLSGRSPYYYTLIPIGDLDADGVADVLAAAKQAQGGVVLSGSDGVILRTVERSQLVPRADMVVSYSPGADLDGDGVDDFVVNLGSYERRPERDCSYAYSGRDLSLLKRLR